MSCIENQMDSLSRIDSAVVLRDVSKSYSRRKKSSHVLQNLHMTVSCGTIYGLLGPSGGGKTTILKCILGTLKINEGSVKLFESQSDDHTPLNLKIGYMPQDIGLTPQLTVNQTVLFFGTLYGMKKSEISSQSEFLLDFLHIKPKDRNKFIDSLSGGQKRRLSFALALLNSPHLLILDEPTVGVDPVLRKKIWDYLFNHVNETRATVIITTHYIEEARMAHNVGLLYNGRLLVEGPPQHIIQHYGCQNLEQVFFKLCKTVENQTTIVKTELPEKSFVERQEALLQDGVEKEVRRCISPRKDKTGLMHWQTIKALSFKNLLYFFHHKGFFMFEVLLPAIIVIVFCATLGNPLSGIPLGIINHDSGNLSHMFLDGISSRTILQVPYNSSEDSYKDFYKTSIAGFITLQQNFTESMMRRLVSGESLFMNDAELESGLITITVDTSAPQLSLNINTELLNAYQTFSRKLLGCYGLNPMTFESPVHFSKQQVYKLYGENLFNQYFLPSILFYITFFIPLFAISMHLVIEKSDGCFERVVLTGVSYAEFIIGYYPVAVIVVVIQLATMLLVIFGVYGYRCLGSYALVFLLSFIGGLCSTNCAFFLSAVCKDETSIITICFALYLISIGIQGVFWPLEGVAVELRALFNLLPLARPTNAMRCIILRGWGISHPEVYSGFLTISSWMTGFMALSLVILRWRFKS